MLTGALFAQFPDGWYPADVIMKDHYSGVEAIYFLNVKAKNGFITDIRINDSTFINKTNPSYIWTGGQVHFTVKDKQINSATALVYIRQKNIVISYMIIIK